MKRDNVCLRDLSYAAKLGVDIQQVLHNQQRILVPPGYGQQQAIGCSSHQLVEYVQGKGTAE